VDGDDGTFGKGRERSRRATGRGAERGREETTVTCR
jgi:hypothetical protein